MGIRLVDFNWAAYQRAPKGATHWRLLDIGSTTHPEMPKSTDDPVFNGTLVFEWCCRDAPEDIDFSREWTKLKEYPEEKESVLNEFKLEDEDKDLYNLIFSEPDPELTCVFGKLFIDTKMSSKSFTEEYYRGDCPGCKGCLTWRPYKEGCEELNHMMLHNGVWICTGEGEAVFEAHYVEGRESTIHDEYVPPYWSYETGQVDALPGHMWRPVVVPEPPKSFSSPKSLK